MKNTIVWLTLCTTATLLLAPAKSLAAFDEPGRQALRDGMKIIVDSLKASKIGTGETLSLLPVRGDQDGYIAGLLKAAITESGKTYVEGKDDPLWAEVLKEAEWDARKTDMLDAATLVKFGKLKASTVLVYGTLRAAETKGNRVYTELELHAASLKTKEHLWGGVFAKRYYTPGDNLPKGLSAIPVEVRGQMQGDLTQKIAASLRAQQKLAAVKSVVLLPLAGDIDRYVTGILRDSVLQTSLTPRELDVSTPGATRLTLREKPNAADAFLYGALRDASSKIVIGDNPLVKTTTVNVEIQVCLEQATTGDILWSDTILSSAGYKTEEGKLAFLLAHPWIWKTALGVIIGLIVLFLFLRFATRVR